jgi:uncharacterized protein (TIGR00251 family)
VSFLRAEGGDVWVSVLAQPRASRTRFVGELGGWLKVQLAAPPVDGEANDALVRAVAERLGLPRSQVEIVRGETGRRKTLRVRGVSLDAAKKAFEGTQ